MTDTYFRTLTLEDGTVCDIPIRKDGYIYATELCKRAGKKLERWKNTKQTKNIVQLVSDETQLSPTVLIEVRKGGNNKGKIQGTWVNRKIAIHLAMWCSDYFVYQVSNWIDEWISFDKSNHTIFLDEIYNLKPNDDVAINRKETEIQLKLQQLLGGDIEVETDVGFIDLLTNNEVIEIKTATAWKHAVGQVLMYSLNYPSYKKRIHLFDIENVDIEMIKRKCELYDIEVSCE
jgi:hypothetical protein